MTKVREHCLRLLRENFEAENFIDTYPLASSRGYGLLSSDAVHYLVQNFDQVWTASLPFQSLMPEELRCVLYADELHATNEAECAFGARLKWIAGNVEGRRGHFPRLLPLIRFAFCSRADIGKVENDPLVRASEDVLDILTVIKRTLNQEPMGDVDWWVGPVFSERR